MENQNSINPAVAVHAIEIDKVIQGQEWTGKTRQEMVSSIALQSQMLMNAIASHSTAEVIREESAKLSALSMMIAENAQHDTWSLFGYVFHLYDGVKMGKYLAYEGGKFLPVTFYEDAEQYTSLHHALEVARQINGKVYGDLGEVAVYDTYHKKYHYAE